MFIKALLGAAAAGSMMVGAAAYAGDHANTASAPNAQDADAQVSTTTQSDDALDVTAQTPARSEASASVADTSAPVVGTEVVTNGPVPDTPENRARFGQPLSNAGRHTAPRGN